MERPNPTTNSPSPFNTNPNEFPAFPPHFDPNSTPTTTETTEQSNPTKFRTSTYFPSTTTSPKNLTDYSLRSTSGPTTPTSYVFVPSHHSFEIKDPSSLHVDFFKNDEKPPVDSHTALLIAPIPLENIQSPESYTVKLQQLTSQCTEENTTLIKERKKIQSDFFDLLDTFTQETNANTINKLLELIPVVGILNQKYDLPHFHDASFSHEQYNGERKIASLRILMSLLKYGDRNFCQPNPKEFKYWNIGQKILEKFNSLKPQLQQEQLIKIKYHLPSLLKIFVVLGVFLNNLQNRYVKPDDVLYPPSKLEKLFSQLLKNPSDNPQSQILKIHAHLEAYLKTNEDSVNFLDFYIYEDTKTKITTLLDTLSSNNFLKEISPNEHLINSLKFLISNLSQVRTRKAHPDHDSKFQFDFLNTKYSEYGILSNCFKYSFYGTDISSMYSAKYNITEYQLTPEERVQLTPDEQKNYRP